MLPLRVAAGVRLGCVLCAGLLLAAAAEEGGEPSTKREEVLVVVCSAAGGGGKEVEVCDKQGEEEGIPAGVSLVL